MTFIYLQSQLQCLIHIQQTHHISFQSDFFLSIAMVKFNFELLNSTADVMHMASTQESGNELSVANDSEEDHE